MNARLVSAAGAVLLAACAPGTPTVSALGYELGSNAVLVSGGSQEVGFGRTQSSAIPALTKLVGPIIETRVNAECGATQIIWADGLIANFQNATFVGWQVNNGRSAGVACGSAY